MEAHFLIGTNILLYLLFSLAFRRIFCKDNEKMMEIQNNLGIFYVLLQNSVDA
jgi:hypothetical protein